MTLMNVLTAIPVAILPLVASNFPHAAATIFFTGIGIGSTIVIRIVQAKKVVSPAFMSDNVRFVVMTTGFGMTIGAVLSGDTSKSHEKIIFQKKEWMHYSSYNPRMI